MICTNEKDDEEEQEPFGNAAKAPPVIAAPRGRTIDVWQTVYSSHTGTLVLNVPLTISVGITGTLNSFLSSPRLYSHT